MAGVTRTLVLFLGALTAFSPLTIDMYLPALPTMADTFGVTTVDVQATVSSYLVGLALGQLLYGPLSDATGRKFPLYIGIILYIVASLGCVLAPNVDAMIVLRFFQALGGCVGMIIARAIVRDFVTGQEAARLLSTMMLVMGVAPILAPVLGSYILAVADWRAIFLLLSGFGAACLAVTYFYLPETLPPARRRPGGVGIALRTYGHLLRNRRLMGFVLSNGFVFANLFVYITGSPQLFIGIFGLSPVAYAWLFGSNAAGMIVVSQINRALLRRWSLYQILAGALAFNLFACLAMFAVAEVAANVWTLWAGLLIAQSSLGMISPNSAAAALSGDPSHAGSASSLTGTAPYLLGAAAGALLSVLPHDSPSSMTTVMALNALIAFGCHRVLVGRAGAAAA